MTTTRHPLLTAAPAVLLTEDPPVAGGSSVAESSPVAGDPSAGADALAGEDLPARADLPAGADLPADGSLPESGGRSAREDLPAAEAVAGARRYPAFKRGLDAVVAGTALVVLAPLIGAVWVAVRTRLGKPAFFFQERATAGGRTFRLGKFRTMRPIDPSRGWVTDDDRLTPFGTWLRASSLDELPSLWNILVGDMSVVGPRPLPTRYLSIYSPSQQGRHAVRAGLTGLAQVSGRNNVPWDERFDLDLRYVLLMGPLLDLTIVARTVRTVLSRDGVAEGDLATSTEFPGPLRTPRLRFVPSAADDGDADLMWEARTPQDGRIATCGIILREGPGPDERVADLVVTRVDPAAGPDLVADLVTLLVNRARAADCTHAHVQLGAGDGDLMRAFRGIGFSRAAGPSRSAGTHFAHAGEDVPLRPGDVLLPDDGDILTADIRCLDDPLTAGAGR